MVTMGDSSKVDGTARVNTSWNSEQAYPRKGRYQINLGSRACGERLTVYVDDNQGKKVKVAGSATVNFTIR